MQGKRRPIRKQVQNVVLLISVVSLLLTSAVGIFSMFRIRGNSEDALLTQMEQNMTNTVTGQARLADSELAKYMEHVNNFAAYIEAMYQNPSGYLPTEVLPPDAANANIYSMQRYLTSEDIAYEDVKDEIALMGNLEYIWAPVIEDNEGIISTIYLGTETGFHVCYDPSADLGVTEGSYESYYDFYDSTWYTEARHHRGAFFTEMYPDSYGRGLTISCASSFRNAEGQFAGVVCMDILISGLHEALINVDLEDGAYAFLVDKNADIIASPFIEEGQTEYENIRDIDDPAHEIAARILAGKTSVSLTSADIYYAYTPVENADWFMCIAIPRDSILEPVDRMNDDILLAITIFFAFFVVIIAAVFLFVRRFSKRFTDPLIKLGKDAEIISSGDLDHQAEVLRNDEIGDLAVDFNNMAFSLKEYIENLTTITAEKERIGAELDVATHIQSSMLPSIFPAFPERPEIDIYATMTPAKEVGGDFYDFFMVDDRHLAIVMADVSGKGVPAALFMVIGKTLIKDHTQPGRDLGDVFSEVNDLLCESNSEGLFITAFEGVLDLVTGEFCFVNAGHELPFISRNYGDFQPQKVRPGFVLAGMEGMFYQAGRIMLEPGDKIFQYTDGVTEATNSQNELYGMERLHAVLCRVSDRIPHEILPAVKADIDAFVGDAPQFDDITMLCLEYRTRMELEQEVAK